MKMAIIRRQRAFDRKMPIGYMNPLTSGQGVTEPMRNPIGLYSSEHTTNGMTPKNDIYNYKHKLEMVKRKLKNATISERNKELISQFDCVCFMDGLSKPRRIKLISTLIILAESYLKKDFDAATRKDMGAATLHESYQTTRFADF